MFARLVKVTGSHTHCLHCVNSSHKTCELRMLFTVTF